MSINPVDMDFQDSSRPSRPIETYYYQHFELQKGYCLEYHC